jgi:ribose/xylose/arabinose/galactoside ABC-type transport system permease subunit
MTFVLSAGEIDLSIGAVAGLTSVTTALALAKFGLIGGIQWVPLDDNRMPTQSLVRCPLEYAVGALADILGGDPR